MTIETKYNIGDWVWGAAHNEIWTGVIKDILAKKACFHDRKLVKEVEISAIHYQFIYICQKCGEIKQIDVK